MKYSKKSPTKASYRHNGIIPGWLVDTKALFNIIRNWYKNYCKKMRSNFTDLVPKASPKGRINLGFIYVHKTNNRNKSDTCKRTKYIHVSTYLLWYMYQMMVNGFTGLAYTNKVICGKTWYQTLPIYILPKASVIKRSKCQMPAQAQGTVSGKQHFLELLSKQIAFKYFANKFSAIII